MERILLIPQNPCTLVTAIALLTLHWSASSTIPKNCIRKCSPLLIHANINVPAKRHDSSQGQQFLLLRIK